VPLEQLLEELQLVQPYCLLPQHWHLLGGVGGNLKSSSLMCLVSVLTENRF
jgi:hypothetical protein